MSGIMVSSRVRLARNYEDLPFRPRMQKELQEECVRRTLNALRDMPESYRFVSLRAAEENEKQVLVEKQLITPELTENREDGAALIRQDEKVSVLMNEEDHLRIQGFGDDLNEAAENVFNVEDALQRKLTFAFDGQLGYLTACPTKIGTGMRASVTLHLPMLTILKQMGQVNQLAARLGLNLRGVYGEGSEAWGHLYQLSNQVTLGRTEQEILDSVSALAKQISEMENAFREKTWEKDSVTMADQMFRSLGIAQNARRMSLKEFMAHYSSLRLGAAMEKLPLTAAECDALLLRCQPGHVRQETGCTEKETDERRSDLLRQALRNGKE